MIDMKIKTNIEEYLNLLEKVKTSAEELNELTKQLDEFEILVDIEEDFKK